MSQIWDQNLAKNSQNCAKSLKRDQKCIKEGQIWVKRAKIARKFHQILVWRKKGKGKPARSRRNRAEQTRRNTDKLSEDPVGSLRLRNSTKTEAQAKPGSGGQPARQRAQKKARSLSPKERGETPCLFSSSGAQKDGRLV